MYINIASPINQTFNLLSKEKGKQKQTPSPLCTITPLSVKIQLYQISKNVLSMLISIAFSIQKYQAKCEPHVLAVPFTWKITYTFVKRGLFTN